MTDFHAKFRQVEVANILKDFSAEKQASILNYLNEKANEGKSAEITSLWIGDFLFRATPQTINELGNRNDVEYIDYDLKPIQQEDLNSVGPDNYDEITWNVQKISAPGFGHADTPELVLLQQLLIAE